MILPYYVLNHNETFSLEITISFQSIKAALANSVKNLRTE